MLRLLWKFCGEEFPLTKSNLNHHYMQRSEHCLRSAKVAVDLQKIQLDCLLLMKGRKPNWFILFRKEFLNEYHKKNMSCLRPILLIKFLASQKRTTY